MIKTTRGPDIQIERRRGPRPRGGLDQAKYQRSSGWAINYTFPGVLQLCLFSVAQYIIYQSEKGKYKVKESKNMQKYKQERQRLYKKAVTTRSTPYSLGGPLELHFFGAKRQRLKSGCPYSQGCTIPDCQGCSHYFAAAQLTAVCLFWAKK